MTSPASAALPLPFPFAAIAGQPQLRQALLLAAVDPALGGVLIEGPRGTAKSTAARALAELLAGAPFVTLPLGASLEHLVGTLDLGQALAGHAVKFAPGLLSRADGGVLYVDEVNLLPDALIDSLLDVAASGVNRIERDGISHRHAARFVLVGTMNPEEGELRPQLLDRFGLCVRLHNIDDAAARTAIVRARLAFDADPPGFRAAHADAQGALALSLGRARATVADRDALPYDDAVHAAVGALCLAAQVDGLRADLVMLRAARALAAWEQAERLTPDHVRQVAELVLLHRRKPGTERDGAATAPSPSAGAPASGTPPSASDDADWGALPPEPVGIERVKPLRPSIAASAPQGAAKKSLSLRDAVPAGARQGDRRQGTQRDAGRIASSVGTAYDWPRTLMARGADALRAEHLRRRPQEAHGGALHCFLLDCSASMVEGGKLARAKGVLLALMDEAYRRRDRVALLCFGGDTVALRVPPRRAGAWNDAWLAPIGGGGGTPLALGVQQAAALLAKHDSAQRWLWLLTDGRSNEHPARPAGIDAISVLDFEPPRQALRRAAALAERWKARYMHADEAAVIG